MSKYTTEVRFICEHAAGLTESVGYADVDEVLENSYDKIFKVDKIPMFEGETSEHRKELYKKILGHYYTREIGFETVGLWKQKLNQKMIEIMPYYNKLYETELIEFDPMKNIDRVLTDEETRRRNTAGTSDRTLNETKNDTKDETRNETINETKNDTANTTLRHEKKTSRGNDTNTNVINSAEDSWVLFSDTPEGGITGIENAGSGNSVGNNAYLTNATHTIHSPSGQTTTNVFGDVTEQYNPTSDKADTTITNTQTAITDAVAINSTGVVTDAVAEHNSMQSSEGNSLNGEHHITGKEGTESYSKLLEQYRKTLLNIDMKVIDELKGLFINIW